jgi:drug/metabolite transporter (DMT)-like permease
VLFLVGGVNMNRKLRASIMLFITAIIWGLAFVAQAAGMEHLGPYTFTVSRSFVACIFLLITHIIFKKSKIINYDDNYSLKRTVKGGMICGVVFTLAINLQQIGLIYTTTGKAGFITALYIVFIPIIGLFFGKKPDFKIILCIIVAMAGTYIMSIKGEFKINRGDIEVLLSAFMFAVHMMLMSRFSNNTNSIIFSLVQFFVCGLLSLIIATFKETIDMNMILKSYVTILYVGILSSGVGFTIQIMALKDLDTVIASMISSLESVFGAVFGWIILGQVMNEREILGASLIFVATLVAQVPLQKIFVRKRKKAH